MGADDVVKIVDLLVRREVVDVDHVVAVALVRDDHVKPKERQVERRADALADRAHDRKDFFVLLLLLLGSTLAFFGLRGLPLPVAWKSSDVGYFSCVLKCTRLASGERLGSERRSATLMRSPSTYPLKRRPLWLTNSCAHGEAATVLSVCFSTRRIACG